MKKILLLLFAASLPTYAAGPPLTDLSAYTTDDSVLLTFTVPSTRFNGTPMQEDEYQGTLIACRRDNITDYPTPGSDAFRAVYDAVRHESGVWESDAVWLDGQTDQIVYQDFVPTTGQHHGCKAIGISTLDGVTRASDSWSEEAVVGKFALPASPAPITDLSVE